MAARRQHTGAPGRAKTAGAGFLLLALAAAAAGCLEEVPGVVIDHEPSPSPEDLILDNDTYIGSPSLAILPDGTYVASHDLFGGGSTEETSGVTEVFRSTDRGESWTQAATLDGQFWSTVFVHAENLFIFGYTCSGDGDLVIRTSGDGGFTWSTPADEESGLLRTGNYGGTPNRPVVHEGRLWIGQSTRLMSAPVDADLLRADAWTPSNGVPQDGAWLDGRFEFWSEGQVTASPAEGVVLLPKIKGLPYTGLLRASGPDTLSFDAENGFVELPGAEKKFGAAYDPVSGRYYVLCNPVLPAHADNPVQQLNPEMIRNTAAVLSSPDLRHWDVERIFLYSPHIAYEAFQYLNFAFDGEDLAVVSRTAFNAGGYLPPRGHDSNLMTFHRIPGFRELEPLHVLVADTAGNRVLRYEETQHQRAPLGGFPLGTLFDGAPLALPVELAQDAAGDVYVREQAGRILRFDAAGNFLEAVSAAPVPFEGAEIAVVQPPAGDRSWTGADSGRWEEPANWYYWGRPDTPRETAWFGSAAGNAPVVTLDRPFEVAGLVFRSTTPVALEGSGRLTIATGGLEGALRAEQGSHAVRVPLSLACSVEAVLASGTGLTLDGPVDLAGNTLAAGGGGRLALNGDLHLAGGRLIVSGESPVALGDGATRVLDGTLELAPPGGIVPAAGDAFDLLDFTPPLGAAFSAVELPDLPSPLTWDVSSLYATGVVRVDGP